MPSSLVSGRRRGSFRSAIAAAAIVAFTLASAACHDVTRPRGFSGMYSLISYDGQPATGWIVLPRDTIRYSVAEVTFSDDHAARLFFVATDRSATGVHYDSSDFRGSWSGPTDSYVDSSGTSWDVYEVSGYGGYVDVLARIDEVRIGTMWFHRHF
ncbi:MAG TPA: hypothetical protein VFS44_12085 [Gemmatimonadaceae bacterium]|nr:hypothetical protein [Gemmatimonadaceae bacterium]